MRFAIDFFLLFTAVGGGMLLGQSETGAGTLNGTITDPSGASVSAVAVTATNRSTGWQRVTQSTAGGVYNLGRLPVGTYTVTFEKAGFRLARYEKVAVSVGAVVTLDVTLEVGVVTETVEVTSEAGAVETARSQTSTMVGDKPIRDLPIDGRNFLDFTTLTPGVVRNPRGGDLSFGGSAER